MNPEPPTIYLFAGCNGAVNFVHTYAPLADLWQVWNNTERPPVLTLSSERANLRQLENLLLP